MIFHEAPLKGAFVIEIERKEDHRGYFGRSYCKYEFESRGLATEWAQMNVSFTKKAFTLRGMHYQVKPYQEVKLVRCTRGKIFDVIVDLRPSSPTFKLHYSCELSEENSLMLYVPCGFAHGFMSLCNDCEIAYQVSSPYSPEYERTLNWNDKLHSICWPCTPVVISTKDSQSPLFDESRLGELEG